MHLLAASIAILHATTLVLATPYPQPRTPLDSRAALTNPVTNRNSHWHGWPSIKRLFVFGDSYTSNGFNPAGIQPNTTNPDGRSALNSSSSDGSNWAEYLTDNYNQSFIRLYDMAVGGATVNKTLAPEIYSIVDDFSEQVANKFLPYYYGKNETVDWSTEHSLFATFFGINDIIVSNSHQSEPLWNDIFDSYLATLEVLYTTGARNFLILKAPAINRAPGFNLTTLGAAAGSVLGVGIATWNDRINALAYNLTLAHADTTVFVFDTNKLFNQVLDYTGSYLATLGLSDTTSYCANYSNGTPEQTTFYPECAVPVNQYFWLNTLHPTWPIHNCMAQQISAVLTGEVFGQVVV